MKKHIMLIIAVVMFLLTPKLVAAAGQQPINIIIDGEIVPTETPPIVTDSRVLVPVRSVAESLGYYVLWDKEKKDIFLSKENTVIKFNLNNPNVWKDGIVRDIDVAPTLYQNRVYLPIRPISESIGGLILWDGSTKSVKIQTKAVENSNSERENLAELNSKIYRVVIDPGHGGYDPGAISAVGYKEKDLNLAIALKVAALLEQEPAIKGILTRDTDYFISLNNRVELANNLEADLFISIHANAIPGSSYFGGTEIYYNRYESLDFARVMHKYTVKGTQFVDRGIHRAGFRVIKYTNMPAVLLELGYLTNYNEAKTMVTSGTFQRRVAQEIVNGIKDYLNIK